jgi:hypothetical protein
MTYKLVHMLVFKLFFSIYRSEQHGVQSSQPVGMRVLLLPEPLEHVEHGLPHVGIRVQREIKLVG